MIRARHRWIAAMLLVALAFLGGPDILPGTPQAAAAATAADHDQRAADDVDPPPCAPDRVTLSRRRLPARPVSRHGRACRAARTAGAAPPAVPSRSPVIDVHPERHLAACSPAALQVFRC